ncbi:hypothetical protein EA686_30570, partial [Acinetobacter baumannii]
MFMVYIVAMVLIGLFAYRATSDDVLDKTLNAMLATYDPHSNYYPPIDAIELNRQTTLQLEGI